MTTTTAPTPDAPDPNVLACAACGEQERLDIDVGYEGRVASIKCKACRALSLIQLRPPLVTES
jgi:hypothetical protein